MAADAHREFKNRLYGQFARIGKALSSPHRLELLAQGERTGDSLAGETGLSLANTSQHLQALRQAALVDTRKEGLFVQLPAGRSGGLRPLPRGPDGGGTSPDGSRSAGARAFR